MYRMPETAEMANSEIYSPENLESGQSPLTARLSLLALMDMQLLALQEKPFALTVLPKHKTNPDDSIVWQRIQTLKNQRRREE